MTINMLRETYLTILGRIRARLYSFNPQIKIGKGSIIDKGAILRVQYGGYIEVGRNCYISSGVHILTHGGTITIGDNCTVNPCSIIYGQGGCKIGNSVRIAAHCVIVPSNHKFNDRSRPIYLQGLECKGISIEDDCWLGAGVKVLDGVSIRRGCVIGANSVLNKSTQPYGIYVGVPAKLLRTR